MLDIAWVFANKVAVLQWRRIKACVRIAYASAVLVRSDLLRDAAVHPLEAWAACCTNWTAHVPPAPERVAALLDYNVFRQTGDVASAKAAAQHYLAERPYLMTRPSMKE